MAEQHKAGGKKAQGFAANPENINREGRPKDPMVQKFRDALDKVITPDEWAKALVAIINSDEVELEKKLPAIKTLVELRVPGIKLPPEVDLEDDNVTFSIDV